MKTRYTPVLATDALHAIDLAARASDGGAKAQGP